MLGILGETDWRESRDYASVSLLLAIAARMVAVPVAGHYAWRLWQMNMRWPNRSLLWILGCCMMVIAHP